MGHVRVRRDHFVGQVGNLRRIVNPPAGSEHNAGESPEKSRYVGQAILPGNLACSRLSGGYSRHARLSLPSPRRKTKRHWVGDRRAS
jgi:hypothetical protein